MEFNSQTILFAVVIIGQIVGLVVSVRKPNEDQNVIITRLQTMFDERFKVLTEDMTLVKQNHLPHIENKMNETSARLTRIEVILDERLPKKNS
jgi:hypothetical protein